MIPVHLHTIWSSSEVGIGGTRTPRPRPIFLGACDCAICSCFFPFERCILVFVCNQSLLFLMLSITIVNKQLLNAL